VLLKLIRAMQAFRYDPAKRFRGWLMTVVHHAWQDLVRGRRQVPVGGDPAAGDPLQSLAARDDLAAGVEWPLISLKMRFISRTHTVTLSSDLSAQARTNSHISP